MGILKNEREQKFISIYQSYIDEVYQYVYLRTALDKTLAEDIVQDIFLDVFKGLSGFKGLCSERTWVFKITRNKLNDFYRKQYSQKFEIAEIDSQLAEQFVDSAQNVQEMLVETFEREKVHHCLNNLSEQYKITLILKYIDGKSVKEIASIAEKSPKAMESILQRAKSAFIKLYKQYEKNKEVDYNDKI